MRELLQNARDADATRVEIGILAMGDARARLGILDDGFGMSFGHARDYLFTLYASSKHDDRDAGRFGVGFWSVLRFTPERIVVRSWPAHGEPWEIELDGALRRAARRAPPRRGPSGTEILLERAIDAGDLERNVTAAARTSARFLTQRRFPRRELTITVDGRRINEPFELPPPRLSFADRRRRGVVSLGRSPHVELHAQGLLVRSAPTLEDLLSRGSGKAPGRDWFQHASEGVAPQAILDDSRLDLLLARGDARNEREVNRLVRKAHDSLRRLIRRQLDHIRPRSLRRRAIDAIGAWRGGIDTAVLLFSVTLAIATVAGVFLWSRISEPRRSRESLLAASQAPGTRTARGERVVPHRDLGALYAGPRSGASDGEALVVALRYRPAERNPYFAALVVADPDAPPGALSPSALVSPYRGATCRGDCMEIEVTVEGRPGPVRLPCPVGHRIMPESVRLDGRPFPLHASRQGEAVVILPQGIAKRARIVYGAGIADDTSPSEERSTPPHDPLRAIARRLLTLPVEERVEAAAQWVLEHVRYSTAAEFARRHASSELQGVSFVERALAIGAGDCDVQNGVLVVLLQDAGIPARLVVGYLGEAGRAIGLHAWAEHRIGPMTSWKVLDLSVRGTAERALPGAGTDSPPVDKAEHDLPVVSTSLDQGVFGIHIMPSLIAIASCIAAFGVILLWSRRMAREARLVHRFGLVPLLRGALERPDAFREAPEIFWRPLLPLLPRGAVSLGKAWSLAERGKLYSAHRRSALMMRASRSKNCVLDATRAESALVASALGAVPLDEWDERLSRGHSSPLLNAASLSLSRPGERWRLAAAPISSRDDDAGARSVLGLTLDSRSFWSGESLTRHVIVDARAPWLRACERLHATHPAEAVFDLVDRVLDALGCPESRRLELLAPLARAALREVARS